MLKNLAISASRFVMVLALVLHASQAKAQGVDLTTGLPAVGSARVPSPKVAGGTCAVIWDLTHGVCLNYYEPSNAYIALVYLLATRGISVSTTTAGLDHIDLSPYSVIVINVGSSCDSPYTPSEVAAIQSFQARGGGLLIMGDNSSTNNANINPVSAPLGTTCGLSSAGGRFDISNFIPHVIFTGVHSISMEAWGRLGVTLPSVAAAFDPDGSTVVSVVPLPRTIITGDANLWDEANLAKDDNQRFATNVFNWLCLAGPTPAKASTWGSLKAIYR